MASLRELKTKWQIRYYDGSRDPSRTTDSIEKTEYTESEAESEAEYRQQLYDRGRYDPWTQAEPGAAARVGDDPTLKELADLYVEEKRQAGRRGEAGGWTKKTYQSDAPILKDFARKTGPSLQASRLRTSHVRQFVYGELEGQGREGQKLSTATKRGYHRRIRAMLQWAEKKGLVPDPPDMPAPPKKQDTLTEVITEAELEEICAAHRAIQYTTVRHSLMWRFLFYQGLRPGEAYDLRIGNVYWDEGRLQIGDHEKGVRQKSGNESLIPLLPPGRFYLRPFLERELWGEDPPPAGPADRAFGAGPGARRPSSSFKRAVRAAASEEDMSMTEERAERISMYTLRHSCATHWLKEGRSQVQTTMEYVHLAGVDLQSMG